MTQRNAFRAPGVWNLDLGIYKTIAIREGLNLQFRGELFNAFNHHNYYLVGDNTDVSSTNIIGVMKGGTGSVTDERRNVQLAVKIIF
jgi:hypothetical protein